MDSKSRTIKTIFFFLFAVNVASAGLCDQSATTAASTSNVLSPPRELLREKRQGLPSGIPPPGGSPSGIPPPGGFPSGGLPSGASSASSTTSGSPSTTGSGSISEASTVPMTTVTPAPFTGSFPAGLTSSQPVAVAQQATGLINPVKFPDSG